MMWGLLAVVAAAIEARAVRRHRGTLSEAIARTWHTETPAGRAAWLATLAATTAYMAVHITRFEYSAKAVQCES